MVDDTANPARIGPNAILQLVPVVEQAAGPEMSAHLLAMAGIFQLPDPAAGMIDERPVARLHQVLRLHLPEAAAMLTREAGWRTGEYILAHRIPQPVQAALRLLPARLAASILTGAIARHAWTFSGSGRFEVLSRWPPVVAIADNPVVRGETSDVALCHWHAAVFERLFTAICGPGWRVVETACCAQGAPACLFEVQRLTLGTRARRD